MRIINICDSKGEMPNEKKPGEIITWDNWVINCIDNIDATGKDVKKPNGSGKYVGGNPIVQYKIKKTELPRFYNGDLKALIGKDFVAFFNQQGELQAINVK